MNTISRAQVSDKMKQWVAGTITATEVHAWVTDLLLTGDLEYSDWEGDRKFSVTREALAELEMLDMNLICGEDAPVFIEFLNTPQGGFESGYIAFIGKLQAIDLEARKKTLKDVAPYAKHCS